MNALGLMRHAHLRCLPALVLLLVLASCGDDNPGKPADGISGPLVFTRENGSVVTFPTGAQAFVWCGDWEPEEVPVPSLHVWFGSPTEPRGWWLRAVLADTQTGDSLFFPNEFVWDEPDSVDIFLADPPNELSTSTDESSGFILFHRIPCRAGTSVEFSIDAVLGSELGDMPPVAVRGRFTAPVTGAPPGWARMFDASRRARLAQKRQTAEAKR
jgi:hypothetical protein